MESKNEFYGYMAPLEREDLSLEMAFDISISKANLLYETIQKQNKIHMMESEYKVLVENGSYEDLYTYYESNAESNSNKNPVQKILDAISSFIKKIIKTFNDAMDKLFGNNVEAKNDVLVSSDPRKDVKEAKELLKEGKNLIEEVDKKDPNEKKVSGFVAKCEKYIEEHSHQFICAAISGAAMGAAQGVVVTAGSKFLKINKKDLRGFRKEMADTLTDLGNFSDNFVRNLPFVKQATDAQEKAKMAIANAMAKVTRSLNKTRQNSSKIIITGAGKPTETNN